MSIYSERADEMLQTHGLRRTPGRIALLKFLAVQKHPISMELLKRHFKNQLDDGSLYRAVETFLTHRILISYDFGHGHAHYELAHDSKHHHHAICEKCGKIEDVPAQDSQALHAQTLKQSPGFASFKRHSLEFYGLCVSCAS